MSKENDLTLAVYDKMAQVHLDNSTAHDAAQPERARKKQENLSANIREAFSSLPKGAKILEIGSGSGINAKALESLGYDVTASDVAPAFIAACEKLGLKTIKFNALKDEFPMGLSGILCWRVFVHFTREDIAKALTRIYAALPTGGRFMFNVIDRETHDCDGEMIDYAGEYFMGAERYYAYYTKEEILDLISKTDFKIVKDWYETGGHNNWFCFVLEK